MEEIVINYFLQSFASPLLNLFFQSITYLGHPAFWMIIAAWLFWRGKEKQSFVLVSITLFSLVVSGALKLIFARVRPNTGLILEPNSTYSMPSGHATLISSIYVFSKERINPIEKEIFFIAVFVVAISRIYLGVHFLTDVFVGLLLGYIIGKFFLSIEKRIHKTEFRLTKLKEEVLIVALFLITIISLFALPSEFNGAYVIFGYYAGFVIHRHLTKKKGKVTKPQSIFKIAIGTIVLIILAAGGLFTQGIESQLIFFIAGVFVTLLWPFIISKFTK